MRTLAAQDKRATKKSRLVSAGTSTITETECHHCRRYFRAGLISHLRTQQDQSTA